jgi:hypothetical protein
MKELTKLDKDVDRLNVELNIQDEKQVQYILDGSIIPHDGHILFEINLETLHCKPAEFFSKEIYLLDILKDPKNFKVKKEVVKKPKHIYISALNKANALKRFHKMKGSAIKGKKSLVL